MNKVCLAPNFLKEVVDDCARSTVGKVLKRIDIFDNTVVLKKEVKELIYEEYRALKNLLEAHSKGLLSKDIDTTIVTFNKNIKTTI